MKKVLIITHYYNSLNYGGNLQAYALCEKIKQLGYDVEQLSYQMEIEYDSKKVNGIWQKVKRFLRKFDFRKITYKINNKKAQKALAVRNKKIICFNKGLIPHTEQVYDKSTVHKCVEDYDVFVTGSDQVWNLNWYVPAHFLDFAPSQKTKISYAASLSVDSLTDKERMVIENHLQDFDAISVREQDAVDLIKDISPKTVEWVLDPTLLLNASEWDEICADRIVDEKYIFCYFLGNSVEQRNVAEEFAKKYGLKLVTLPYLNGKYRKCDKNFGDIRLFDVGPQEFLSLIKYADFIFTDSFHAMVFAGIYKRQHFEFLRDNKHNMSSRIYSLCELYETAEHFCDTPEKTSLEYIESVAPISYNKPLEKLSKMKEKSLSYLRENLR